MKKYKVLVTARSFAKVDKSPIELLEKHGCQVVRLTQEQGDIRQQLADQLPQADAIIAGLEVYDKELLGRAEKLKVISRYGVGYDKVDVNACSEKNIAVTITPGANEDSVADMAITLMLSAARNVCIMDRSIKEGKQVRPTGVEMWRKTLGVVGTGRIGKGVIKRARGFEMKVLCYDMYPDEKFAAEYGAQYVDFDTLVKESDFISLHTPFNEQTKNLFGEQQFKQMKNTAVLVNTARGGIIDEAALYKALKDGEIAAAGLDATVAEPPYGNPLLELANFTVSPHIGATTYDAIHKMSMMAAENIIDVLETGNSRNSVKA